MVSAEGCAVATDGSEQQTGSTASAYTVTVHRALKLNKRGSALTNAFMSNFASQAHTITAWVMPEFSYTGDNQLLSSTGSDNYIVAIANYSSSNGGTNIAGDPYLYVKIGSKIAYYLAPGFTKRKWHHVALKRTPYNSSHVTTFQLFIDGTRLTPKTIDKTDTNGNGDTEASEIHVSDAPEITFNELTDPPPAFTSG